MSAPGVAAIGCFTDPSVFANSPTGIGIYKYYVEQVLGGTAVLIGPLGAAIAGSLYFTVVGNSPAIIGIKKENAIDILIGVTGFSTPGCATIGSFTNSTAITCYPAGGRRSKINTIPLSSSGLIGQTRLCHR